MPIKRDLDGVYFRIMRDGVKTTKTWLRNALFRLTADIQLIAEEQDIVAEKE